MTEWRVKTAEEILIDIEETSTVFIANKRYEHKIGFFKMFIFKVGKWLIERSRL